MKKTPFLLLLLTSIVYSQGAVSIDSIATTKSPNAFAFQEMNFIKTDEYVGKANIDIPIWKIQLGDLSIPISLSYNTRGVKVNSTASDVGLNWNLNAGGVIVKEIRGQFDFRINHTYFDRQLKIADRGFLMEGKYLNGGITEGQPDKYNAIAPGLNTTFVHQSDLTPLELEKQGNRINTTTVNSDTSWSEHKNKNDIKDITITSNSGYEYEFKVRDSIFNDTYRITPGWNGDLVTGYGIGNCLVYGGTDGDPTTCCDAATNSDCNGQGYYNSYNLNKITNLVNEEGVSFEYEKYFVDNFELRKKRETIFREQGTYGWYEYRVEVDSWFNRIKKIKFKNGEVNFIYSDDNRIDIPNSTSKMLTEIQIINNFGQLIKKVRFIYDYFSSIENCNEPECYRLKLKELYFEYPNNSREPCYKFTYHEEKLPKRYSYKSDFFGYYNGVNVTSELPFPVPKIFYYPFEGRNSILPFQVGEDYYSPRSSYSLEPNFTYTKAATLKEIQYPKGGKLELNYEANSFLFLNEEITGGGLRIESQILKNKNNEIEKQVTYNYKDANNITTGSIVYAPRFADVHPLVIQGTSIIPDYSNIDISNAGDRIEFKVNNNSLLEGVTKNSYVGYGQVTISEQGNGSRELSFSSPKSVEDIYPNQFNYNIVSSITPYSSLSLQRWFDFKIDNGIFPSVYLNLDIKRGKILLEKIFNNDNNLIREKEYNYTYKSFTGIVMPEKLVFTKYRINNPNQYSYVETSSVLNSERNLLSTVVQTDYLNDNITSNKTYDYDSNYPFLIGESITSSSNEVIKNKYYYPFMLEPDPEIAILMNQNRISHFISKETYLNTVKMSTEKTAYKNWGNNLVLPNYIKTEKGNSVLENRIQLHSYYDNGNIKEASKANGTKSLYIWGYNEEYLIAKIENANYSDIASHINNIQNLSNLDDDRTIDGNGNEGALRVALNSLRNLPVLSKAMITSYTYDPLIGMTSMTTPNGYTSYYQYDSFNRLELVKDSNNKILESYKYNIVSSDCDSEDPDNLGGGTDQVNCDEYRLTFTGTHDDDVFSYSYTDCSGNPVNVSDYAGAIGFGTTFYVCVQENTGGVNTSGTISSNSTGETCD